MLHFSSLPPNPIKLQIARSLMTIPRPTAPILAACLFAIVLGSQPFSKAQSAPTSTQQAAKDFRTYLNYQVAKIDAKAHPMTDSRPAHQKRVTELSDAVDKIKIKSVRKELKDTSTERTQIIRLLRGRLEPIPRQLLSAETKRVQLEKMRADETLEEDKRPGQPVFERIDAKITWIRQRETLYSKELAALTKPRTAADSALDTYNDLINLGDAKLTLANLNDEKMRAYADSTVKLISARVHGNTLESIRPKLPLEQLGLAIENVATRARPLPGSLRSPANSAPDRRKYFTELQQFYESELEALRLRYEELSKQEKKPAE